MDIMDFLKEDLVIPQLDAKDKQDVIIKLGNLLFDKGYVKKTFVDAVIEREKKFPTGLPMEEINVAIPHTDAEHVLKPAIAIGVLNNPVNFNNMADPESELKIDIVFVIALNDGHSQPELLQELISIFQDSRILISIKNCKDASSIIACIKEKFN